MQRITLAQQLTGVEQGLFEVGQVYITRVMAMHRAQRSSLLPAGRSPAAGGTPVAIPPAPCWRAQAVAAASCDV
jgi:hypothetical protein